MKDADNQEITLGDRCATAMNGSTDRLIIVQVCGFSPKKVRVRVRRRDGTFTEITKFPQQLAKVERQKK